MGGDNFLLLVFADGDFLVTCTSCWPLHTSAGRLEPGAGHLLHWPATAAMCLPLSENGLTSWLTLVAQILAGLTPWRAA